MRAAWLAYHRALEKWHWDRFLGWHDITFAPPRPRPEDYLPRAA